MSLATARPAERAVGGEGREALRLLPGQRAAEAASAAPQPHGHQIVVGRGKPRAGEADQHAALRDPAVQPFADLGPERADIGQHDHRQLLIEEARDGGCGRAALAEPHVGEGAERARQIEGGGEQRLRRVGGGAGDDADRAAAPALVEQLHRAGRALAGDFQPRDVVAQLDRQVERGFGLGLLHVEDEASIADRRSLRIQRAHQAGFRRAGVRAQHLHHHARGGVFRRRQRMRRRDAAVVDRQLRDRRSRPEGPRRTPAPRPVSTPSAIQTISASPVAFRKRVMAGSMSTRSTA